MRYFTTTLAATLVAIAASTAAYATGSGNLAAAVPSPYGKIINGTQAPQASELIDISAPMDDETTSISSLVKTTRTRDEQSH